MGNETKSVVITGASQGIGAAIADEFATQGANLTLIARNQERLDDVVRIATAKGAQAIAVAGDVAQYQTLHEATRLAMENFGALDVLVNNAGLIEPISTLAESDPEHWATAIDVNLKGVYHGLRAVGYTTACGQ